MSGDPLVTRLVEEIDDRLAGRPDERTVAVSRGVSPQLRDRIGKIAVTIEAPAVRGRAVWTAVSTDLVVVEQPNWWGRLEIEPPQAAVLDRRPGVAGWDDQVRAVRRSANTIAQLPGVRLAHGEIEAPWFVVLLPFPASDALGAFAAAGVTGAVATDRAHAELPGGIRLAPPGMGQAEWLRSCVASIAAIIGKG